MLSKARRCLFCAWTRPCAKVHAEKSKTVALLKHSTTMVASFCHGFRARVTMFWELSLARSTSTCSHCRFCISGGGPERALQICCFHCRRAHFGQGPKSTYSDIFRNSMKYLQHLEAFYNILQYFTAFCHISPIWRSDHPFSDPSEIQGGGRFQCCAESTESVSLLGIPKHSHCLRLWLCYQSSISSVFLPHLKLGFLSENLCIVPWAAAQL